MKHRIEAQGGNQAHLTLPAGMPELDDTVGLIAQHGDGDLRQPASYHPDHLACPLGNRLMPQPQTFADPRCGRRHAHPGTGRAQKQEWFQGGVMTRASTIQRSPLVVTVRLRLEARGSR